MTSTDYQKNEIQLPKSNELNKKKKVSWEDH